MSTYEVDFGRVINTDEKSLDHALHFQERHLWGTDQLVTIGPNAEEPGPRTWAQIAVEQIDYPVVRPNAVQKTESEMYKVLADELHINSANSHAVMDEVMKRSEKTLREEQNQVTAPDKEVLDTYFRNNAKWLNENGYLSTYLRHPVDSSNPAELTRAGLELEKQTRDMYRLSDRDDHELMRQLVHSLAVDLFANLGLRDTGYDGH